MLNRIKNIFTKEELKSTLTTSSTRTIILAIISLLIPVTLTFIEWENAKADILNHAERSFKFKIDEASNKILKRMHTYEQVLLGGIGLFAASDTVTREEWKIYVENLKIDKNFPGILGIGYSYNFRHDDSLKIVSAMQKEGFHDFKILPEGIREEYSVVIYIEPFNQRNRIAFGYDLLSEPMRKSAMLEARDNGQTTITGKISMVRETEFNIQAGFIIFIPFYVKNYQATTVEKRRELFKGYVYSPFRMKSLMQATFGNELENINLQIFDGDELNLKTLMYDSDSTMTSLSDSLFVGINSINLYGEKWSLKFTALPEYLKAFQSEKPTIVLTSGIIISLLFFLVIILFLQTKKSSNKLSGLLESTGEGIFGVDTSLKCSFINRSALNMLGYKLEECIGRHINDFIICKTKDTKNYISPEENFLIESIKKKKTLTSLELILERKNKTSFPAEFSSHPIVEDGEVTGLVVTFNDITERLKVMEQIQRSLQEKDVLLREIHHRVKNNLQIISSLLNLQAGFIEDKRAAEVFEESKNRVRSMALIHEKLYESKNFSSLDMREFIEELVKNLYKSYGFNTSSIALGLNIDDLSFDADQAVYLGLVVNELVSNSFKHAFKLTDTSESGTRQFKLYIHAKQDKNMDFIIKIGDNGIGFPKNIDFRNTESLGLRLVVTLVKQLGGEIELIDEAGTNFVITIKNKTA